MWRLKSVRNCRVAPGGADSSGSSSTLPASAGIAEVSARGPAIETPATARIATATMANATRAWED